jgi:5-methylcytosine-specific restriction protein B
MVTMSENIIRFWQISPGREERGFWLEFKNANIIAMGWDRLGNLKTYSTEKEIENALRKHYPTDYPKDKYPGNDIKSIKIFSQLIKEGDVIVAKKGMHARACLLNSESEGNET